MLQHLPLDQLAVFAAAARHVSFTAAAAELGVTQSAVSQQVRLLEERLGRRLFRRLPRGLALTDEGRALLPLVSEALERLQAGLAELFGPPGRRALSVRAPAGWAQLWLAPRLAGFLEAQPGLEVRFSSSIWAGPGPEPGIDLEIRVGAGTWPGLLAERLSQDLLLPVAAPGPARRLRRPADLAELPLLATVGFREGWPAYFAAAGLPAPRQATSFDTAAIAIAAAEAGAGVALGRAAFVLPLLQQGRLAAPLGLGLETEEAYWLLRPAADRLPPPAERFRAWLLDEAARDRARLAATFAGVRRLPPCAPPGGS